MKNDCSLRSFALTRSIVFPLALLAAPILQAQSRLINLSSQTAVPVSGVTGTFRIDGSASKTMLIRAVGPTFGAFGIAGTLADPQLSITNVITGTTVATNDDWGSAANAAQVATASALIGALPLIAGSKDAVVYATLPPGTYSATVTGAAGSTGTVLFEIYDASASASSGSNISYFALKGPASLFASFVIGGTGARQVLVRALGPSLGGTGTLADPSLSLLSGRSSLGANNDWGGTAALTTIAGAVGASTLPPTSRESALTTVLNPGAYSATVSGGTGTTQFEVFDVGPAAVPTIATQPQSQALNTGSTATFTVAATGTIPFSYQWLRNGSPISGATNATLSLANVTGASAGSYSVVVTNATGSSTSASAALTVASGRIVNLSVNTTLAATQVLSVGFFTSAPKSMLVRAVGPTLGAPPFDLPGMMADPKIEVFDSAGVKVDSNDDWSPALASVFGSVAAFPFSAGSKDAALQRTISGLTSMQVSGTGPGQVLVETYDTSGASTARLTNVSARNRVGTGSNILIAGFVTVGGPVRLLVRGVGPALGQPPFNLSGVLAEAKLEIYSGSTKIAENDRWDASLAATFASVGAFALPSGSKDAALVITLQPGAYTAQLSGIGGGTGDGIIEVYEVP